MIVQRLRAETAYLMLALGSGLLFSLVFTANTLYYATVVRLSPLELVLVGTTLEVAILLFEVPTGVVADVVSRRLSILIGFTLVGCGFLLEGLVPTFAAVIAAAVIWGVGYTFTSGATQAWLSDEIGEADANRLVLRVGVLQRYAGFVVIPLSVVLAFSSLQTVIIVGGAGFLGLAAFLTAFMPETNFQPHPHAQQGVFQGMRATVLEALRFARASRNIRTIFVLTVILGAASESFDRLWQVHLLSFGFPRLESLPGTARLSEAQSLLVSFAAIDLIVTLVSLPLARWAARVNVDDERAVARALGVVTIGAVIGVLGFALAPTLALAVGAFIVARASRGVHAPLSFAWLNQRLEPSTRATVLSLNGQADAVGQIAGGPVIGALGNLSLRLALLSGAVILAVCLPVYARASKEVQVYSG